ncbi:hypothetical protein CLF_101462 [Clonorchis sinensis]|uniref:Uncharacterized protein n=1 Tax=Clonorchis sinensis TaxID=79923 RepID=G7Y5T3_CLOSI|nr:hypothetical protein CLF_101462 [Clonorchis sinensis]
MESFDMNLRSGKTNVVQSLLQECRMWSLYGNRHFIVNLLDDFASASSSDAVAPHLEATVYFTKENVPSESHRYRVERYRNSVSGNDYPISSGKVQSSSVYDLTPCKFHTVVLRSVSASNKTSSDVCGCGTTEDEGKLVPAATVSITEKRTTKPWRRSYVQFVRKLSSYALKAIALMHERH